MSSFFFVFNHKIQLLQRPAKTSSARLVAVVVSVAARFTIAVVSNVGPSILPLLLLLLLAYETVIIVRLNGYLVGFANCAYALPPFITADCRVFIEL